jgi:hypothetical protein
MLKWTRRRPILKTMSLRAVSYAVAFGFCLSLQARAAVFSTTYSSGFANSGVIPDANPNGLQDTHSINSFNFGTAQILDVNVRVNVDGGFNGDLFAFLSHDGTTVVLLNRVGATASSPYGYLTPGMNVTFDASAATDIHLYGGAANITGIFQPDQRTANPASAIDTSPRGPGLDAFNGLDPNGTWTIYFADMSGGGETHVVDWGLDVAATAEPIIPALGILAGLGAGWTLLRLAWQLMRGGKIR